MQFVTASGFFKISSFHCLKELRTFPTYPSMRFHRPIPAVHKNPSKKNRITTVACGNATVPAKQDWTAVFDSQVGWLVVLPGSGRACCAGTWRIQVYGLISVSAIMPYWQEGKYRTNLRIGVGNQDGEGRNIPIDNGRCCLETGRMLQSVLQ